MATESTRQVLSSTVDVPGLSVISSSRHPDAVRAGSIYDTTKLAAAVPVWFHPMNNGNYLALFARRMISAVPASPLSPWPLLYTSSAESVSPCWAMVSPATGIVRDIGEIPSRKTGGRELTAATSRGDYLFVLNRYDPPIDGDENTALLQHFRVSALQGITLMTEEIVPGGLSLGMYPDKSHLVIFGDDGSGLLTAVRKNWGRIGVNTDINPSWSWQVLGKNGWASRGSTPVVPLSGNLPAHGPCSLARYRDTYYLMASTQTDYPNTYTQTTVVGTDPHGVTVSPDGTRVYVANRASKSVSIINPATNLVVATVSVGSEPIAVAASNSAAYVVNADDNTVMVINASTRKVTHTIEVGTNPTGIAITPDGSEVWVTVQSTNVVQIIDTDTRTVTASIPVGQVPQRLAFSPDGTKAYVTNFGSNSVWMINTATRAVLKTIAVGNGPIGVAVTPDGDWVFVANATGKTVSMIPTLTYKPLPEIGTGPSPIEIAASDTAAYVINQSQGTVTVISVKYRDDVAVIQVGRNPHGIAISPDHRRLYVTNRGGNSLSIISTITNSVLPVPEAQPSSGTATVDARDAMNPFLEQINALLYGVINGFIRVGTGVVSMITSLLDQAVSVITGTPLGENNQGPVKTLVNNFLESLTGIAQVITDPAAIFEQIIGALTGIPVVGNLVTVAQQFLQNTINTILNLTTAIVGPAPIALLEEIIRTITGIFRPPDTNDPDPEQGDATTWTGEIKLIPESSWKATTYSNKRVQEEWTKHSFSYDLAPTDRTFLGGASLQDQLPLKPGFGSTVTSAGMTLLDEVSEQIQVFTGSSPHLVVLPKVAKILGTTVGPDGLITIPETTGGTILPMIRIEDAVITEGVFGPKLVKFRISLSAVATDTVTVRYTTSNQTATAGRDYLAGSDIVVFEPGVLSQQFTLTVYGDLSFEPDETFLVTLSDPVNAVLGEDISATCTIVNDDRQTLVESLLEDFKNIINGVISGAIKIGSALVKAVVTILEQSVKTVVGAVVEGSQLVVSMVDAFLNLITGGLLDIPGDYGTPAENLADIIAVLTNGAQGIGAAAITFANEFLDGVTTSVTAVASGVVSIFQNIIGAVINVFSPSSALFSSAGPPILMSASSAETNDATPVFYTPYVIHNQSTADIKVMASSRDKEIVVKHGSGLIFTPYAAEPTSAKDWSWSYALERAPRTVQGFPFLATRRLFVNTYRLMFTGSATGGTFRLTHNGTVTASIDYEPLNSSATASGIRDALTTLESITEFTVTVVDANSFVIVLTNDTGMLNLYSYRLIGGNSPTARVYRRYVLTPNGNPFVLSHNGTAADTIESSSASDVESALSELDSVLAVKAVAENSKLVILVATEADANTLTVDAASDADQAPVLEDETDTTMVTRWAVLEPSPAPATPSGVTKTATFLPATVTDTGTTLPDILAAFTSAITTVAAQVISVGPGVITTVTGLLGDAVALITGDRIDDTDGSVTVLVTEFLQSLAREGASQDAATSFENILRQITGGTGLPDSATAPTPLEFITTVVDGIENSVEDIFTVLSDLLQKLLNAITGK